MSTGHENIDEGLLLKYWQEQTSEEENQLVKEWLQLTPKNSHAYESFISLWEKLGVAVPNIDVDVDAAWEKVSARIKASDVDVFEPKVRRINSRFTWLAAASVAALVGLFALFQHLFNTNEVNIESQQVVVEQVLSDGSSIALNKDSKLWYPKEFKGEERKVKLEGEAFFDIERDENKPFIIEAGIGQVKVLGTSFNVEAYKDQDIRVQVISGKVELSLNDGVDSNKVVLLAGNTGIINRARNKVYKESEDYEDALFWLNKRLIFDKTPLPKVLQVLEKNYGLHFTTQGKDLSACMLTARFENENIEDILSVIGATFNIQFSIGKEVIEVIGEKQNCGEDL